MDVTHTLTSWCINNCNEFIFFPESVQKKQECVRFSTAPLTKNSFVVWNECSEPKQVQVS